MKTYIVAVDKIDMIDMVGFLFPMFTDNEGNRYIMHRDPSITVYDNEPLTNFDYLISHNHGDVKTRYLIDEKVIYLERPGKDVMQVMMKKWAEKNRPKNFIPVPTFFTTNNETKYSQPVGFFGEQLRGKIVIKPIHGARGIGHAIMDIDEVNLASFISDLGKPSLDATAVEEKYARIEEDRPVKHVKLAHGSDEDTHDSYAHLREKNVIAQRLIENIKDEYRLIAIGGKVKAVLLRDRKGDEFKQANGAPHIRDSSREFNSLEELDKVYGSNNAKDIESLVEYISDKVSPILSFDLFVREDNSWGMFEFSNQFGACGLGAGRISALLREYLIEEIQKREKEA